MSINLTDELLAKTKKGKLASAKQVFLEGDKETVQQIGDKTHQLEDAIKDISVTGGASTANAVSYNNEASGMTAVTVQGAIDELAAKNKSHDAEIAKKANSADITSQMQAEQSRVNTELGKKFDKESILQESGNAEDKVMSQKAVSDKLSDLANKVEHIVANGSIHFDAGNTKKVCDFTFLQGMLYEINLSLYNISDSSNIVVAVRENENTSSALFTNIKESKIIYYTPLSEHNSLWVSCYSSSCDITYSVKELRVKDELGNLCATGLHGRVSIIGDSISTFKGWIKEGYKHAYPSRDVISVTDTYWWKLVNSVNGAIEVNASWSGSFATDHDAVSPSFYDRTSLLGNPDSILVNIGTNDSERLVSVGTLDFSKSIIDLGTADFAPAYLKGVMSLLENYPNADILLVISKTLKDAYANVIIDIATHFGLRYADLREYEIDRSDGTHPTKTGMQQMTNGIADNLVKSVSRIYEPIMRELSDSIYTGKGKTINIDHPFKKGKKLHIKVTSNAETSGDGISFRSGASYTTIFSINANSILNKDGFDIVLPCDIDRIRISSVTNEYEITVTEQSPVKGYTSDGLFDMYFSGILPSNGIGNIPFIASSDEEFYIKIESSNEEVGISDGVNVYAKGNGTFKVKAKNDITKLNIFNDSRSEYYTIVSFSKNIDGYNTELLNNKVEDIQREIDNNFGETVLSGSGKTFNIDYEFKKGQNLYINITSDIEAANDSLTFRDSLGNTVFYITIIQLVNKGDFKVTLPCDISRLRLSSNSVSYNLTCRITSKINDDIEKTTRNAHFLFNGLAPTNGISKIPFDTTEGETFYVKIKGDAGIGVSDGENVYAKGSGTFKAIAKKDITNINIFNDTLTNNYVEVSITKGDIDSLINYSAESIDDIPTIKDKLNSKGVSVGKVLTANGNGTSSWQEPQGGVSGGSGDCVLVVAASNARIEAKANADFVCTGENDDIIINRAIQALSADGGEIKLTSGIYLTSNPILIDRRIKITGEGYGICGIPQYTPTDSECKYENLYGSNVGATTIRCTTDIDVIRIYSESKLQGIQLRDFVIQGYGKDRHTKSGISVETDTDVFYMTGVGIYDCHVGFYSHGHNMDAPSIIYNSFQWCACGAIVQAVFGRFVGNCIADNNGIKEYKGLTVNTGGLAISGNAMSILDNQFVRTERYTIPKDGRKFDENLLGSSLSLGYYIDFTNDKKKECGNFIVANNTINQNGGNGIRLLFANFTNVSNNNITTYGLSQRDGFKCGISGDKLGSNTIILGNKIGNPTSENITADQGVNLKCTYGNNMICNNMFTWLSGSSVTCSNSASNNTISNNISIT